MSGASLFLCTDGGKYVFKRPALQRPLAAEHIAGRLGTAIGAPCMSVCYGEVPEALISIDPSLNRYGGGLSHATKFIDGVREARGVPVNFQAPINRSRFARLFVMFSWLEAADHQLMYEILPPNLVYSHDHGLFFPGNMHWSETSVDSPVASVTFPDKFFDPVSLTDTEKEPAIKALRELSDEDVIDIVNGVRPEWGVTAAELGALAKCLCKRKSHCLSWMK